MMSMHQNYIYLESYDILFFKNFIFFPQHETKKWWEPVAINPWYHVLQIMQGQENKKNLKKKHTLNEEDDIEFV